MEVEDISSLINAENKIEKFFYEQSSSEKIKFFSEKLRKDLVKIYAVLEAHLDFEELEVIFF